MNNIAILGDSNLKRLAAPFYLIILVVYLAGAVGVFCCFLIIPYGNAVRCESIAVKKGYAHPRAWFIFGFFLLYIATIVCLLLKNRTKPVQIAPEQAADTADFKPTPEAMAIGVRCTDCDIVNPPDAKTCIQCGKRLY